MNHLWVRLTFAFVLITLLTVGTISWLADRRADAEFRAYLLQPGAASQSGIVNQFASYYAQNQSWEGVASFADSLIGTMRRRQRGLGAMMGTGQPLLANSAGTILYDPNGERTGGQLAGNEQQNAHPIVVSGETVGYLLLPTGANVMLGRAEENFLTQLRRWLIFATLGVGLLGMLLGMAVSRTMAAPLAALATAARGLAKRDWSQRVALEKSTSITEIAEVAHAFNEMAESLEQSEVQRRNLMADVAHELRTPITVLQGNLRAMLDGVYPLELDEIATLYDETRLLSRLVDDLRELALAEAGQLSLTLQSVDLNLLLQAATTKFAPAAEAQQITFVSQPGAAIPPVLADPDRSMQVVHNLVTNALRHTPAGGRIEISSALSDGRVRVSVRDTGEGISAEELSHIFDRFYRTDKSRARRSGGSGLGLTIAKTLVENLGGQIGVESTAGQGSCFWFTLPLAKG